MSNNYYFPVGYQPATYIPPNYQQPMMNQGMNQMVQNMNNMNNMNQNMYQYPQNNQIQKPMQNQVQPMQQQNMQSMPTQDNAATNNIIWVQGEVGEKSFNKPPTLPPNVSIPLWDSENSVIYLKKWDETGKAYVEKLTYQIEDENKTTQNNNIEIKEENTIEYISRDEFNNFKNDMYEFLKKNGFVDDSDNNNGNNRKKGNKNG